MATTTTTANGSTLQLSVDQIDNIFSVVKEQASRARGAGDPSALYSTILSQYDRFGVNSMLPNHEVVGYTFITRPKLNLTTPSLRQDRILAMLDTAEDQSLPFAIRCYLDTNFAKRKDVAPHALACPFFNEESPFIVPLSNNLVSLSGWPDPVVDTETTDGGFFNEDLTMAKGSDRLNRTYDLTLTFRDIQGGFILALLYMWIRYIELVVRGDVTAYAEDIDQRRINYTCSIYRFVMDPSRQFVTKWSKATGCFPKSIPLGNVFNFGDRDNFISSSAQYSVPFTANKIEIWDPIIFRDFNTISKRYCSGLQNGSYVPVDLTPTAATANQPFQFSVKAENNFIGVPWVDLTGGINKLTWMADPSDLTNSNLATWEALKQQMQTAISGQNNTTNNSTPNNDPSATYA
jgi:hypothetical protein